MTLPAAAQLLLTVAVLFAGVWLIAVLTPKIAALIDRRREAPRPERVDGDENISENNVAQNDNSDDIE